MTTAVLKALARFVFWLASRHRNLGVRDWVASILSIAILWIGCLWFIADKLSATASLVNHASITVSSLLIIICSVFAWIPIAYIFKLRRFGITDADFSVKSGIDYAGALKSVKNGFIFSGVAGSKLKDAESEFREAVKRTSKHGGKIRMLLLDLDSPAWGKLEQEDGAGGYHVKGTGAVNFFKSIDSNAVIDIRYYSADTPQQMKPFRIFLAEGDCLLSPFFKGTGEHDQGKGLPQLRITSKGFPSSTDPTLYSAINHYFEINWQIAHNPIKETK